ncbi:ketopantoate reductase family protein [Ammoniphilus sp. YIM 78166]|uniref:ketopantoate reductase family protein n=1 Tax=Ammoniphilus sp. YIM 78166 TaxID=1644106 RepID=UPI00106F17EE|nr:ketopantoate reductase family protein [Ammoniphilus sp. YIM 78166]
MKILVVGRGAVGGYFGGRLQDAGCDVTFLVRKHTPTLSIQSVHGDLELPIQTLVKGEAAAPFDLVILSTKAYHLDQAIEDLRPYVSEKTMILPLLNGVHHISRLKEAFPHVLGGACFIESTVNLDGQIVQTSQRHDIVLGELDGTLSERVRSVYEVFSQAPFKTTLSEDIQTTMWNKYIFITGLSGITTLMDSAMGPILESPYGEELASQLFHELQLVAEAEGYSVFPAEKNIGIARAMGYKMKASMLRDMEKKLPIEADHLQGQFLKLAEKHQLSVPLLKVIYNRLKVYQMNV